MPSLTARALAGAVLCALLAAGCTSAVQSPPAAHRPAASPSGTGSASPVPGLVIVHDPGQVTGTLSGPCHVRGTGSSELPDRRCTPGSVDTSVTAARLCAPGYSTRSYRPPEALTQRFKYDQAYPAYGLPSGTKTELDHLVSLELGGSNDASNLWPETPPTPNPKDSIEAVLHAWVCAVSGTAAQARLGKAQRAIAGNWATAEKVLGIGAVVTPSPSTSRTFPAPAPSTSHAVAATRAPGHPSMPPSARAPVAAACSPLSSTGHCYRRGEFCPSADHGLSGTDASGSRITCEDTGSRWRWELATLAW